MDTSTRQRNFSRNYSRASSQNHSPHYAKARWIFLVFAVALLLTNSSSLFRSNAANPSSATITPTTTTPLIWDGTAPGGASDGETSCVEGVNCDTFTLTLSGSKSHWANRQAHIKVGWDDPTGVGDYDVYVHKGPLSGPVIGKAAGSDNPEALNLNPNDAAVDVGTGNFTVHVVYFSAVSGMQYKGTVTVIDAPPPPPLPPPLATPPPSAPGVPRYYSYAPGAGVGENSGEPSIGYNLSSHKAMYIAGLQTLRVTFPEEIVPLGSVPGACDAKWDDVSYVVTKTKSLDPILFTDQHTGRTFVSQLDSVVPPASPVLIGLNSFMAYTDDDGANWTPAQVNPPDGSYDHQSVGAGPYPASVPLGNPANKGDAVYYCSQAGVTAFCSRSDDGGLNFGRSTAIYNSSTDGCGGIHGHVKVAPDGTVYVPNRGCGATPKVQSITVSADAGITWTVRHVAGQGFSAKAPPGILDPSLAIASDGTLYFSWISGETDGGHAHVAVSHDKGVTWTNDTDLGLSYDLHNAVFIEAVAGDPNRAAVGFIGTNAAGNHEGGTFKGTWYAFIAHTYDGGKTWTTVNATPRAPVQREAGIWNEGGNSPLRNLLDFNEITMDEKGRVLYAFADGCTGDCESGGPNTFSAKATIARQSGGKGLLAQFDPVEPVVPQRACLSGRRDDLASYLRWNIPDSGGSEIVSYNIFRGTSPGNEVLIGHTAGTKSSYTDRGVNPAVAKYTYKITAVNASGEGQPSNTIELVMSPRVELTGACGLPGVQLIVDPTGDETDTVTQHDITSVSIAEPDSLAGKLVFTIKVANLSTVPPNWRWSVRFNVPGYGPPDSSALGPQEDWFVSMISSDGVAPAFTYGTTGVPQNAARFFTTIGNLDPVSNFQPDGTITLVLPKDAIQSHAHCAASCGPLNPGQAINLTLASVRFSPPSEVPGAGGTNETIPDTTGGASYALRPANLCLPNTPPLARLKASVDSGLAPLMVNFDGTDSVDPDSIDTVASYTFNFGDGGDDVTQSSPFITHTFISPGLYPVKLVVTDSRGKVSSNTDQHLITADSSATSSPSPTPSPSPNATTTVQFSASSFPITEGCTAAQITVTRTGPVSGVSTVDYNVNNGTATQRGDFTWGAGTVVFAVNETSKTIPVLISDDSYAEGTESATIVLSNPVGATLGSPASATVDINDNETADGATNPIDDTDTFVDQHYHDFLNRQADSSGHAFWRNEIVSCGTDAHCIEVKRSNVSQAFFLSIEFQNTGYFAFRFYRMSFLNSAQRPRGLPRYVEFLRDEQALQRGVQVGQPNSDFVLEQNKQGFALDWVDRPAFIAEYPTTMTRDQYIDQLFARAGTTPTAQERNQALFAYDSGFSLKEKRAFGIRAVVDSGAVYNAQYNPGFVLLQYFGYLRRNPDNAPDHDFSGYDFWLTKMNQFSQPGEDMRSEEAARNRAFRAEMVKAFLVSGEYRGRFGGDATRGQQFGSIAMLARPGWSDATAALWSSLSSTIIQGLTIG